MTLQTLQRKNADLETRIQNWADCCQFRKHGRFVKSMWSIFEARGMVSSSHIFVNGKLLDQDDARKIEVAICQLPTYQTEQVKILWLKCRGENSSRTAKVLGIRRQNLEGVRKNLLNAIQIRLDEISGKFGQRYCK